MTRALEQSGELKSCSPCSLSAERFDRVQGDFVQFPAAVIHCTDW